MLDELLLVVEFHIVFGTLEQLGWSAETDDGETEEYDSEEKSAENESAKDTG
jgi:hypothetical protein